MNDFLGEEKPFLAGSLRAFRAWEVGRDGLKATAWPLIWAPGVNVADCQNRMAAMRQWEELGPDGCTCTSCQMGLTSGRDVTAQRQQIYDRYIDHVAPGRMGDGLCDRCGFYAYHEPESLETSGRYIPGFDPRADGYICGSIKATGSIILGTFGIRAQKVEVEALWGNVGQGPRLAKQYNVPWFKTREELLAQFPFTPMEGFRYERPQQEQQEVLTASSITVTGTNGWVWKTKANSSLWSMTALPQVAPPPPPATWNLYTSWKVSNETEDEREK